MSISGSDYQGRFTIPTPKGVYQAAGDTNINTDYAYLAQNIRTERGLWLRATARAARFRRWARRLRRWRGSIGARGRTMRTYTLRRRAVRFTPARWARRAG